MITKTFTKNGNPVPDNVAIDVSNHTDFFTLSIHSMDGVSVEEIKEYLQKKYEVGHILQDRKHKVIK